MATFLEALGPFIHALGALLATIAVPLSEAGGYLNGPVYNLPSFTGPVQAAAAAGANASVQAAMQSILISQTDTMTAFFSGLGGPFVAKTGQIMIDMGGILTTMPDLMKAIQKLLEAFASALS